MSRNGVFLYLSYFMASLSFPAHAQELPQISNPGDVQFAFDIHKTLTYRSYCAGLYAGGIRGACGILYFHYLQTRYPSPTAAGADNAVEGMIATAHENVRSSEWACNAAEQFGDAYNLVSDETVSLVQKLGARYDLKVLSNIGPRNWARIQQRYPHIFNDTCINGGIIINYEAGEKIKPHAEPFERFEQLYWQDSTIPGKKRIIIFVDDKQVNVDAANKRDGWHGILFKNLEQLKQDLEELGICIDEETI